MVVPTRGGGRPAVDPNTGSEALDALVLLLREIRSQAGLSVEGLHEHLRIEGQAAVRLPARSTFYKKLNGTGLLNAGRLIEAIVGICARDDRHADELQEQTKDLLRRAQHESSIPVSSAACTPSDADDSKSELIRVQRQLINVQAELATMVQATATAEKEATRARNLATMLLTLGALGAPSNTGENKAARTEVRALRARLAEAEAERHGAHQAASAAQRRLAEVEEMLASRSTHATAAKDPRQAPHRSGLQEWPTTRIEPDAHTASRDALAPASAQGRPRTVTPPAHAAARPSETHTTEHQEHNQTEEPSQSDPALEEVFGEMKRRDPDGNRMRSVIDSAADHLLDPAHTGRYQWSDLSKVEKTALADTVGHRLRREFDLAPGEHLDFNVAGHEVDVKFTRRDGGWMFPPELQGDLCLVVSADDAAGIWNIGLVRVLPELMHMGSNRDAKRRLSGEGRAAIRWIHRGAPLPEHALPRIPKDVVKEIFALRSVQERVEELFLRGAHQVVTKTDLKAVAMQTDFPKRLRTARVHLAKRGVLLLAGAQPQDTELAALLGLPSLAPGTWMSIRLAPATPELSGGPTITMDGSSWRVALPDDSEVPLPVSSWTGRAR
ncbi:NaeI family type II restriction endonuclease [Streptomyces lydicus]|uniref:NaeI family type II restriction endonuclease n=1 Tax=Streptomyces lydicus TaxID=47763 RepID=UPI0036A6A630